MKKVKTIILLVALFATSMIGQVSSKLNEKESKMNFIVRHQLKTSYKGYFSVFSGIIKSTNKSDYKNAEIDIVLYSNSVKTGIGKGEMLRSKDYLDATNHPTITIHGHDLDLYNPDIREFELTGTITVKGITKDIKMKLLVLESPNLNKDATRFKMKLLSTINGPDFGLPQSKGLTDPTTNKTIGEEVIIDFLLIFPVKK